MAAGGDIERQRTSKRRDTAQLAELADMSGLPLQRLQESETLQEVVEERTARARVHFDRAETFFREDDLLGAEREIYEAVKLCPHWKKAAEFESFLFDQAREQAKEQAGAADRRRAALTERLGLPFNATGEDIQAKLGIPAEATPQQIDAHLRSSGILAWLDSIAPIDIEIAPEFDENKEPGYTGGNMDNAADFAAAARTFSDRELKEYIQKGEVAAAVLAERETTSRTGTVEPRPEVAAPASTARGVDLEAAAAETTDRAKEPPRPDWVEARAQGVALPDFIAEKFAPELREGTMTRAMLNRYDKLSSDFYGYPRHHKMPAWLKAIPTEHEWNKRHPPEPVPVGLRRYVQREAKRVQRRQKRASATHP
jgi:hypothetical protein